MKKIKFICLGLSIVSTSILASEKNLNVYQNSSFQYNEFGKISENKNFKFNENVLLINYPYSSFDLNIEGKYPERIFSNINYDNYDLFKNNIGKKVVYEKRIHTIKEVKDGVIYLVKLPDSYQSVVFYNTVAVSDISKIYIPEEFFDKNFYNSKVIYKDNISGDHNYLFSAYDNGINWSSEYNLVLENNNLNLILYGVLNNNTNNVFEKINLNLMVSNDNVVRPRNYMLMAKANDMISSESFSPVEKNKVEELYKYSVKNVNLTKGNNYYKLIDIKNVKYTKKYNVDSNLYIFNEESDDYKTSLTPYVNYIVKRKDNNLLYEVFPTGQYKISKLDNKNIYNLYNSNFSLNTNKDIEFNGGNEVDSKIEQYVVYNNLNELSYKINLSNYKNNELNFKIKLSSPNNIKNDIIVTDLNKSFNATYDKNTNEVSFILNKEVKLETIFKVKKNESKLKIKAP